MDILDMLVHQAGVVRLRIMLKPRVIHLILSMRDPMVHLPSVYLVVYLTDLVMHVIVTRCTIHLRRPGPAKRSARHMTHPAVDLALPIPHPIHSIMCRISRHIPWH